MCEMYALTSCYSIQIRVEDGQSADGGEESAFDQVDYVFDIFFNGWAVVTSWLGKELLFWLISCFPFESETLVHKGQTMLSH